MTDSQQDRPDPLHRHTLAKHDQRTRAHLESAHASSQGQPVPAHFQSSLPSAAMADPTLVNQHYRNSVGSPHHAGAGAQADNPNVELLAAGWHVNRRPRESESLEGISADAYLGRRTPPVTSTRVRPSDYDDDEDSQ
jgi:hypothetical protein